MPVRPVSFICHVEIFLVLVNDRVGHRIGFVPVHAREHEVAILSLSEKTVPVRMKGIPVRLVVSFITLGNRAAHTQVLVRTPKKGAAVSDQLYTLPSRKGTQSAAQCTPKVAQNQSISNPRTWFSAAAHKCEPAFQLSGKIGRFGCDLNRLV